MHTTHASCTKRFKDSLDSNKDGLIETYQRYLNGEVFEKEVMCCWCNPHDDCELSSNKEEIRSGLAPRDWKSGLLDIVINIDCSDRESNYVYQTLCDKRPTK